MNKLLTLYILNGKEIENPAIETLITYGFFVSIGAGLIALVYIFHLFRILINNELINPKRQIIDATKHFFQILGILLVFPLTIFLITYLFSLLAAVMAKRFNELDITSNLKNWNIAEMLYKIIVGNDEITVNSNFLIPNDVKSIDTMNLLASIVMVLCFSGFLVWVIWSVFQKIIEIFFMYLSFPIALAFSQDSYEIRWKIWIREMLNKIIIILSLLIFARVFIYFFYFTFQNQNFLGRWKNDKLYLALFLTLALSGAIIFMIKLIAFKNKEHVGIITTTKSFRQTNNFVQKTKSKEFDNVNSSPKESINANIYTVRNEISQYRKQNSSNLNSLKKVKVFDK